MESPFDRNDICRICHSNGTEQDPLFYPCRCAGSIKYTHQACLLEWLKSSGRTKCEVCGTVIGMIPLYKPDTPSKLSILDFYKAISDIFKKYFKIWFLAFLFINIFGIVTPITIFRVLSLAFRFFSNNYPNEESGVKISVKFSHNLILYLMNFRLFFEIFIGLMAVSLSVAIVFTTFHLLEHLSKLEQPWWFEQNHPDDVFLVDTESEPFSVSNFISEGLSVFNNWVREDAQTTAVEIDIINENLQENVQDQVPMFVEEEYPRIRNRLRLIISSNLSFENFLYLSVVTISIISITSLIIITFTGMATLRINKISRQITSGVIGLISTNMIFNYLILTPILYILHTILKNNNIFFMSKIFFLSKFMVVILIEYIVTPFIYGFLLCRSTHFIKTLNFSESFFIFPLGDDLFILYSIIGLVNIFWIACILFYIHGKMRMGLLFPLSEDVDEITRFLSEILYEPFYFLVSRILKSYTKYIFYFLVIQTLIPYYISFKIFNFSSNLYSHLEFYQPKIEIYMIVHSLILMFKRIHFKILFEILTKNWFEFCSRYLDLESFLFGRVPLVDGEEVSDRLGTYFFSSAHIDERARLTCSAPFYKTKNFSLKIYIFVISTLFLITASLTTLFSIFTILGFYTIKFIFNERIESFHLSIMLGVFVFLCIYSITDGLFNFSRWLYPNRTSIKFKAVFRYVLFPIFCLLTLPYLNGTALRLIINKFECKGGETCLIFPSYDYIIGFILLNMESLASHFMPESVIIHYPIFYSLRTSLRPFNFEIFIYGFLMPYLIILSSFIAFPHLIIFGFGKSLGLDANMQHYVHQNVYFWIFLVFVGYLLIMMNRMLLDSLSRSVRNYRYLIGHQLKNFQNVE